MSFDPRSPSDRANMEPDLMAVCRWCDESIDEIDVSIEAFEVMGDPCCKSCFQDWGEVQ